MTQTEFRLQQFQSTGFTKSIKPFAINLSHVAINLIIFSLCNKENVIM